MKAFNITATIIFSFFILRLRFSYLKSENQDEDMGISDFETFTKNAVS